MPLTAERDTPQRLGPVYSLPVAANVKCWKGGLAVVEAGNATPGKAALSLIAMGRFIETIDNVGGSAGAVNVRVERGVFRFSNSGTDPVAAADFGKTVYVEDDQTVSKTAATNTRSAAGVCRGVDPAGVWVEF